MKKGHNLAGNRLTNKVAGPTVGFRLDEEHLTELVKRALKAGLSHPDLARRCVIEALHDRAELPALRGAILSLEKEIIELRRDIALSVEALLVASEADTPDSVRALVEKNLK